MKHRRSKVGRFALSGLAIATACLWGLNAQALGLGRLTVQSALGEPLRAEIDVTSMTPEEASTLRLRIAPAEAYRAAGVEFNPVLTSAQVELQRRPDGRQVLRLTSDRAVLEPFVDVILEASWSTGRLVREYTMLFDPPSLRPLTPPPTVAVIPSAPAPQAAPARPSPVTPPAVTAAPPISPWFPKRPRPAPPTPRPSAGPAGSESAPGSIAQMARRPAGAL